MNIAAAHVSRILMTTDTVGGVWNYALELTRAFEPFGIRVYLATMGAALSKAQKEEAGSISNLEIYESSFKLEWMDNPWEDIDRSGEWLLNLESEIKPQIIHLNGYTHANLTWQAPVIVTAHSCVLSWWDAVKSSELPIYWHKYKKKVSEGLRAADAVVSISKAYGQQLECLYGPLSRLETIYNGKSADLFYSAPQKKIQAISVGRIWDEAKNLSILEQLSPKVDFPILIAGNNCHPETQTPVELRNVTTLGVLSQPEIRKWLAESLFYILPAKYEPFGLSVLEAALSGCVLILSDIPTLKELWQDSAFYFNPEDPAGLETVLTQLALDPETCQEYSRRSKARARFFSRESMGQKYVALYRSLLPSSPELKIKVVLSAN